MGTEQTTRVGMTERERKLAGLEYCDRMITRHRAQIAHYEREIEQCYRDAERLRAELAALGNEEDEKRVVIIETHQRPGLGSV